MDNFQGNDIILQAKKTGTIMNTQREGGNFKGIICAIISSGTFGLIPLFSIPLLLSGLSSQTILFWRFVLAALMMGIVALATKRSFRISLHEVWTLLLLAVMYSATALCLLQSYNYIPSGVATTISFLYPLAVAIVMTLFFREKSSVWLFVAILISLAGVALLSWNGEGIAGNRETLVGMGYAGLTVMTYMVYIVGVMKSSVSRLDPMILAFYVLLFSSLFFLLYTTTGNGFQTPSTWNQWQNMLLLALIPTVLSNLTLVLAIQQIGSTMTSILGSMEPLTAVLVGVFRFGESFSLDTAIGLILIISAVMIVILNPGRTKNAIRPRHRPTANPILFFTSGPSAAGSFREPSLFDTFTLLEHLTDAPERRSTPYGQQGRPQNIIDQQRSRNSGNTHHQEDPPDAYPEVKLTLDDQRMEQSDNKECRRPDHDSGQIVFDQKIHMGLFLKHQINNCQQLIIYGDTSSGGCS